MRYTRSKDNTTIYAIALENFDAKPCVFSVAPFALLLCYSVALLLSASHVEGFSCR